MALHLVAAVASMAIATSALAKPNILFVLTVRFQKLRTKPLH